MNAAIESSGNPVCDFLCGCKKPLSTWSKNRRTLDRLRDFTERHHPAERSAHQRNAVISENED